MISSATPIPELYWAALALIALVVMGAVAAVGLLESLRPGPPF